MEQVGDNFHIQIQNQSNVTHWLSYNALVPGAGGVISCEAILQSNLACGKFHHSIHFHERQHMKG